MRVWLMVWTQERHNHRALLEGRLRLSSGNDTGGVDLGQYGDDVASILIDFAQTKTNEQSVLFARDTLVSEVGKSTKLLNRPWRSAGFAVLKAPDVPSVLVELGYLTNQAEGQRLQDGLLVGLGLHAVEQSLG